MATVFTVWVVALEVLVLSSEFPRYVAVMECEPATSDEMEQVATPLPFRATLLHPATGFTPSRKFTFPAGTAVEGAVAVTVAVNVTAWLTFEVAVEALKLVVVLALATVRGNAAEVLVL